jgi:hypothetical protein
MSLNLEINLLDRLSRADLAKKVQEGARFIPTRNNYRLGAEPGGRGGGGGGALERGR